ncbi:MAG: phosphatidylserine decarboxylase [Thermodesulfobacteriota bacterium]|nr:phosphatidylserine decarboxylase [Thermodesulfobacteriota bacterium]
MISRTGHYELIAREAYPFMIAFFLPSVIAWWWVYPWVSLVFLCLTAFVAFFFRNPERVIPGIQGAVLAPADGVVAEVLDLTASENLPGVPLRRVSIFMSVFNVHVNRAPVSGKVTRIVHIPGTFVDAREASASLRNERNSLTIITEAGEFEVVQIAGKIARRIVCWVTEGDNLNRGDRFGLIRFGSRVDVYMPLQASITVTVGSKVKAGETAIARYP